MILHPAVGLLLWVASVVVLQSLSGDWLRFSIVTLAVLAALASPRRTARLVKRARWLLVALFAVFAWATPGRLMWPEADWASPTAEGLALAIDHAARVLGLLMLVALLLEFTSREKLLAGVYSLLKPLALCGLDRTRAALRLGLVLQYAEQKLPRGQWRAWLRGAHDDNTAGPVRLIVRPLRVTDLAVAATAAILCAWAWLV